MKLGKRAPRFDGKRLKLRDYLPTLPPLPDQQDWIGAISAFGMMLNNNLGDCVFAGLGHAIQTWTANVGDGSMITVADADILKLYEDWAGYNPDDPSTDQGYVEVDALNNFRKSGFAGHQLLAYADPDPGNLDHVKASILLLGGIYIGLQLPLSAQGEEVWSSTSDDPGTWGGHCLAPGTRVLTSDLRWIPIESVSIGSSLLGFSENPSPRKRWYLPSRVMQTTELELPCYDLEFSDGSKIRCSHDHLWLCSSGSKSVHWLPTEDMICSKQRFSRVCKPIDPWPVTNSWALGYLAGAFDGEGWLTRHRQRLHRIGFAQRRNEMLTAVEDSFKALGFSIREGRVRRNGIGKKDCVYLNIRGKSQMLRFLGQSRPPRLLSKFDPLMLRVMEAGNKPRLISKKKIGNHRVIALATSTRTFIAEGFASHNCVWVPRYRTASDGSTIFTCVTWGEPKDMTQAFWLKYCDESHSLVSSDFATNNVAASGFNLTQLQADLAALAS